MIKLTQERIENLLEFNSGEVDGSAANAEAWEVHELARIALASLKAETAAEFCECKHEFVYSALGWQYNCRYGYRCRFCGQLQEVK